MISRFRFALSFIVIALLLLGPGAIFRGGEPMQQLRKDFCTPPESARPWVYWFWLNQNITREGITADLEAMKRVGIGGVLIMEVDQGAPKGPVAFNSPEWRALFKHVCAEANRLGLEVNMNNDAGWCGSGGPWITPELSMQRVVWTETRVEGPKHFEGALAQPTAVANYYRDIAVWAFPTPSGDARIESFREKAADIPMDASPAVPAAWPAVPPERTIPRDRLVNLTARLNKDGRIAWNVPEGKWTILRLGHTTTGKDNHPAPESGRGLECDKLSKEAVQAHFEGLMGKLIAEVGPLAGKSLVATHIDSWEVGSQNWTPKFREEFQRRRGYDLLPFLAVMTGRIVDSREVSERFLWDLRQTINELLLQNYAGHFRRLAHEHGLRLSIEAYTNCPADEMAYAGRADEPMGEFWSWEKYGAAFTCTEMASAAHVYGKPIVGAEAFTATDAERWLGHPASIKELGDWAFCEGINRFVFHRYALQPWLGVKPGMSMGPWGLHYERTQTWWEQSAAWHAYLARCQSLLQQGLFVADVCYLGPEGSPQTLGGQKSFLSGTPGREGLPRERTGYNFDTCPPEVVLTRMTVEDGRLTLPDGMSYRLLVLPMVETMTPQLLGKIKELVEAGATVAGALPAKSPSLSDYPRCDDKVRRLSQELWGSDKPPAQLTERRYGKGRIFWSAAFKKKTELPKSPRDELGPAQWIWHPEGNPAEAVPPGKRFFRRIINLDAGLPMATARLMLTADNAFTCWINGHPAGSGNDYKRMFELDVAVLLKPGQNLLAIEAENGGSSPNPAGLIGALTVQYSDGRILAVPTDKTWESTEAAKKEWNSSPASGNNWTPAKELGPLGMRPWGEIGQAYTDTAQFPGEDLVTAVLEKMGVPRDFSYQSKSSARSLRFIHRTVDGTEVYFVANKLPQPEQAVCTFRVRGKRPELWRPDTGEIERPAVFDIDDGMVRLPIALGPSASAFVVFGDEAPPAAERIISVARNNKELLSTTWKSGLAPAEVTRAPLPVEAPEFELTSRPDKGFEAQVWQPGIYELKFADGKTRQLEAATLPPAVTISGPWDVRFEPGGGAPERVMLEKLISWSEHPDKGIKFYSGSATYTKALSVSTAMTAKECRLWLDLGKVEVMAEVKLNGRNLGILWKPPYRVEITGAVEPGQNTLEVNVVNLWVNRQIGDEFLAEDSDRNPDGTLKVWPKWLLEGKPSPAGRTTFTSWRLWHKNDRPVESGLLGPVRIILSLRQTLAR
jgi:hypothetical protein